MFKAVSSTETAFLFQSINEVVTGMIQNNKMLPIGYIPAGSTNDFAKSLDISDNMVTAAHNIVEGSIFPCDTGLFNNRAFVCIAAFGLFTEVSYATGQHLKITGKDVKMDDGMFEVTLIKRPSSFSELNQLATSLLSKKRLPDSFFYPVDFIVLMIHPI